MASNPFYLGCENTTDTTWVVNAIQGTTPTFSGLIVTGASGIPKFTVGVMGTGSTTTDDLPVGTTNLYYTDALSRSAWRPGSGFTNGWTVGDMSYISASETLERVPLGTDGHYLKLVSGVPTWSALSAISALYADGSAAAPSVSFTNYPTFGLYYDPTYGLSLAASGVRIASFAFAGMSFANNKTLTVGQITASNGSYTVPAYSFSSSSSSGIYYDSGVGLSIAGAIAWFVNSSGITFYKDMLSDLSINSSYSLVLKGTSTTSLPIKLDGLSGLTECGAIVTFDRGGAHLLGTKIAKNSGTNTFLKTGADAGTAPAFAQVTMSDLSGTLGVASGGTGSDLSSGGGGQVVCRGAAGSALTMSSNVSGFLKYLGSSTKPDFTAITGTDISTLSVAGTSPTLSGTLPIANGGTNKSLPTATGAVVWRDASNLDVTAVGLNGQVLRSNVAGAPTWATSWITIPNCTLTLTSGGSPTAPTGSNPWKCAGAAGGTFTLASITGITTAWRHIKLIFSGWTQASAAADYVRFRLNNDTGGSYLNNVQTVLNGAGSGANWGSGMIYVDAMTAGKQAMVDVEVEVRNAMAPGVNEANGFLTRGNATRGGINNRSAHGCGYWNNVGATISSIQLYFASGMSNYSLDWGTFQLLGIPNN